MRYFIVTPAKNESDFIGGTIRSVKNQTLPPIEWIIVDDGSSDDTLAQIRLHGGDCDWIKLSHHHEKTDVRIGGARVVRVFNTGYRKVSVYDYDFLVKLDADLVLPPDYFALVAQAFAEDPDLGMVGGYCVVPEGDGFRREASAPYHVRGAFKSIRRKCWEAIGGFQENWAWDGIDEMEAMRLGWKTKTLDLPVVHRRPTSGAYKDPLALARRSGVAAYQNGHNLLLTLARSAYMLPEKPLVRYAGTYLFHYLRSAVRRLPKELDADLSRFMNRFHMRRLIRVAFLRRS